MKTQTTVLGAINAVTHSSWMRPAVMMLAILASVIVVTGCGPSPHPH